MQALQLTASQQIVDSQITFIQYIIWMYYNINSGWLDTDNIKIRMGQIQGPTCSPHDTITIQPNKRSYVAGRIMEMWDLLGGGSGTFVCLCCWLLPFLLHYLPWNPLQDAAKGGTARPAFMPSLYLQGAFVTWREWLHVSCARSAFQDNLGLTAICWSQLKSVRWRQMTCSVCPAPKCSRVLPLFDSHKCKCSCKFMLILNDAETCSSLVCRRCQALGRARASSNAAAHEWHRFLPAV